VEAYMKRFLRIAIAIMIICLAFSSCSFGAKVEKQTSGTVKTGDGEITWSLSSDGMLLLEGTGTVENVPVDKEDVKSVVVSSGFKAIGVAAFKDMPNLSEIKLPESLEKIGSEAFENCKKIVTIDIPDTVKEIASSAFKGWEEHQQIIAEWYEGSVENWREWYEYEKEFGDINDIIEKGGELTDEMKAKLGAWWQQWKDSGYWEKVKEHAKVGAEKGAEVASSGFYYWKAFGEYIMSEDSSAIEEGNEWWAEAKKVTEYIEEKYKNASAEVPDEIKGIVEAGKKQLDAAVEYMKEKAKSITAEDVEKYVEDVADKLKDFWNKFTGGN